MTKPPTMLVLESAVTQIIREIFLIPVWWYTHGLSLTFGKLFGSIHGSVRFFSVDVWAKNLFVPMYGDESFTGRAISFLVRFVVLIVRSLGVVAWSTIALILGVVYVVIFTIATIGFFTHLIGVLLSYA